MLLRQLSNYLSAIATKDQIKKVAPKFINPFEKYQNDPVGFGEQILGHTYTDDIKELMLSVRDNQVTIAKSCNAVGKSLPIDTQILTSNGFKRIDSITLKDKIYGKNGKEINITGIFPQGLQPTYKIEFNDDTHILCSKDHLWSVRSSNSKSQNLDYKILSTKEIIPIIHRFIHIPLCKPIEFKKKDLSIDPYVLGILIGNGSLSKFVRFDTQYEWILNQMKNRIKDADIRYYRKTHYGITTGYGKENSFLDKLKSLGMIGIKAETKFIPKEYLIGDINQRKLMLAGLMDTDGYIGKNHSMVYTTVSKELSNNIQWLIWSLGGTAKIRTKIPHYTHNGKYKTGQKAYNVYIKIPFCPFTLPKKKERYKDEKYLRIQAHRIIKKITYQGKRESICIKVNSKDGLFITKDFIVTHNTHAAAAIAFWFFQVFQDSQIYTCAFPEPKLRQLLWGEIGKILIRNSRLVANYISTDLNIRRNKSSFITGVTVPHSGTEAQREARFSGRHAPHLMFILDEGDTIPDEVYRGIESCMSGGHFRLLILFNPREEQGPVYRMERDGIANVVELQAFNHPNVITGKDIIPGAVDRNTTARRINLWSRPLMPNEINDSECFEIPNFLIGCKSKDQRGRDLPPIKSGTYKITSPELSYMVLARYPAQSAYSLISRDWINKARARWDLYVAKYGEIPPSGIQPIMGLDIAEFGIDQNCECLRYGNWIPPLDLWSGVDTIVTGKRAYEDYRRFNCCYANVDGTGVGAGVAPHMINLAEEDEDITEEIYANSVKVASKPTEETEEGLEFCSMRDQLWWSCAMWLKNDQAMLPPDEDLGEELLVAKRETVRGKIKIMDKKTMRELLKRSPDRADSVCLTFAPDESQIGFGGFV